MSGAQVFLVHDKNEDGAGFYEPEVADVLLRCGEGWSKGNPKTGKALPATATATAAIDPPPSGPVDEYAAKSVEQCKAQAKKLGIDLNGAEEKDDIVASIKAFLVLKGAAENQQTT